MSDPVTISITFPDEKFLERADERAAELDMNRSQYVRSLVRTDLLKAENEKPKRKVA